MNVPTRGQKILDVFITNVPNFWNKAKAIKSLVRSNHLAVLLKPVVKVKATRKTVEFRDLREHNKLKMLRKMDDFQWDTITNGTTCPNEMINNFYNKIWPIFDECFPVIKTRVSSRDPPFLSPIVKHLLKLRKNAVNKRDNECSHRLQEKINKLIRVNQLKAVKQENKIRDRGSKRWWSLVNKITGRGNSEVPLSHIIDPKVMNEHFQTINTDPDYVTPQLLHIPDGTRVPELSVHTVCKLLLKQKRTTSGPDELPYWFWNTYAYDIAPVITTIFNTSIKLGIVPDEWKLANLLPIPKESPCIEPNQLRPISLTNIIVRLFERAIYTTELSPVMEKVIHEDQFAYKKGHSSTMALIKAQHTWMEWLDGDASMVRVFSFDFSKAFDTVPHEILCNKLKELPISPYIINWIIDFLTSRYQRIVIHGIKTNYLPINRGVPQGTVLGPILFSIMINDIRPVQASNLIVKFADDINLGIKVTDDSDTSHMETNNIKTWAETNRMKLNLKKTWEMVIHGKIARPLPEPLPMITRKSWLKILGVTFQENPTMWDLQMNELMSRACSRLYIIRTCKYYGFSSKELDLLFHSLILSILVFGIEVWGCASYSKYLSQIDKFLKRSYKYGYLAQELSIVDMLNNKDRVLWKKITTDPNHALKTKNRSISKWQTWKLKEKEKFVIDR